MSENIKDYKKFLEEFKIAFAKHEKRCEERRRRGIHDLNIFDVLETKEVKHSRFLSALLDPDGLHYQNDLFLREFVDICELKDFDFDTSRAKVYKEYNNIDIYITDGDKHIIIENKIGTGDHDEQIARYIQAIVDEQDEQDEIYERILVLYLTPFDTEIKSLGGIDEVGKDYLKLGQNQVAFRHISYKNEILKWIGEIKAEIANLIDLSVIITQYEKIVKNLTNQGEEMQNSKLKDFVWENYEICGEIYVVVSELTIEKVDDFFKNHLYKYLKEKLDECWVLEEYKSINGIKEDKYSDFIFIAHENFKDEKYVKFCVQAHRGEYGIDQIYYGFVCKNKNKNLKNIIEQSGKFEKIKKAGEKNNEKNRNNAWAFWKEVFFDKELYLDDFLKQNDNEKVAQNMGDEMLQTLNELKDELIKLNKTM
ncbi:PDDEXK-like family protein [Campylobacter hyointestinalis]|uniref:PDDEXK-like family protein n=1 Tax=Campylobacter hyointestinalis TaxID=198 RepID=UPI0015EB43CB|nr:PD-(D/E)XK nuclease family protein [Campylobacter hyointestinalis]